MTETLQPFIPDDEQFDDSAASIPFGYPQSEAQPLHPFIGTVVETPYSYLVEADKKPTIWYRGTIKGDLIDNDGPYYD